MGKTPHPAPQTIGQSRSTRELVEFEFWTIWHLREKGVRWGVLAGRLQIKERTLIETWFRLVKALERGEIKPKRRKALREGNVLSTLWAETRGQATTAFKSRVVRDNYQAIAEARQKGHSWQDIGVALKLKGETVRRVWQRENGVAPDAGGEVPERLKSLSKKTPKGRRRAATKT